MSLRERAYVIIFGHDTPAGKNFDVALLWAILLSVVVVTLDSIASVRLRFGPWLTGTEYLLTALFTLEYLARLWCVPKPWRYARSFFGLVDLLALLPSYLELFVPGSQSLAVIRILRLLRVFRVLKLVRMSREAEALLSALAQSRDKIIVFLGAVLSIIVVLASAMYAVEGPENGFKSIPLAVYWAIVTMTTVGYGDIAPQTVMGQALAAVVMLLGYAIIAVPTGIVTVGLADSQRQRQQPCPRCGEKEHLIGARFCHRCAEPRSP